jgi:hypothetical protein
MDSRQCTKCKKVKVLSEFNKENRQNRLSDYRSECKLCQYTIQTKRYWREHHKPIAKSMAREAYKKGKLQKPLFCEYCGQVKSLDRHHPNYKKPLQIVWLCRKCHATEHAKTKSA